MSTAVVVVDDEPHVLQVMRTFLERAGFAVHTAANGEDGLQLVRKFEPAAVITDFEMPQLNGRELIERVMDIEDGPTRLMFLVTSRTDLELRDWVEQYECVYFLEKLASPRRLVQLLKERLLSVPSQAVS
jgi:two-component system response regulator ResD